MRRSMSTQCHLSQDAIQRGFTSGDNAAAMTGYQFLIMRRKSKAYKH